MARTLAELPKGARITDFVSLGVPTEKFPRTTIDRILQETGRASKRERNLPAHVVVYYVIALALYRQVSYGRNDKVKVTRRDQVKVTHPGLKLFS